MGQYSPMTISGNPRTDAVSYGPDIGTETELRLLGHVADKRVLELGCGRGERAVAFARQGAHVIGVSASGDDLAAARRLADHEGVKIELRHGDLAELAFVRADSIDLAFSAYALGEVDDLPRVFRQVHRVLKTGAPLVFSLLHPVYSMLDTSGEHPLAICRSYFDGSPIDGDWDAHPPPDSHLTVSDLFTALMRTNFRVDAMVEPRPRADGPRSAEWHEAFQWVPHTLVVRA